MTKGDGTPLRRVPREHPAKLVEGSELEHAASPEYDGQTLCGVVGNTYRHLFEDVGRRRSCPACQALSDAVRASDLLGAVRGAARRGDIGLADHVVALIETVEVELRRNYPPDESQPDFDVFWTR